LAQNDTVHLHNMAFPTTSIGFCIDCYYFITCLFPRNCFIVLIHCHFTAHYYCIQLFSYIAARMSINLLPVADPEVLARKRGHKRGGFPEYFWILKIKMAHFCALLSIDFKVCRLITETVSVLSDLHIRKTVTNRLCFPFLFQRLEARTRKYCDSGYKQPSVQGSCSCQFCHDAGDSLWKWT